MKGKRHASNRLVGIIFTLVLIGAGLLLGMQGSLQMTRDGKGAITATQTWRFAGAVPLVSRAVHRVTDARMIEQDLTMKEERSTAYRDWKGTLLRPESLILTGDSAMGWPYREDLSLIRNFLRNPAARPVVLQHPVDVRANVSAWLCLGLGLLCVAGFVWEFFGGRTSKTAFRQVQPLPQPVGAASFLGAVVLIGLFYWQGHVYFGSLAERKVKALHEAALTGDAAAVQKALQSGVWPDARDEQNATALHMAAVAGSASAVEVLLSAGANVGALDLSNRSALIIALEREHLPVAERLLQGGADPMDADLNGRNAIHHAASAGFTELLQEFQKLHLPLDKPDAHGWTPLFFASSEGKMATVQFLLQVGANPQHVAQNGGTVSDAASQYPEVRELLNRGR